jgi:hypothetical protein
MPTTRSDTSSSCQSRGASANGVNVFGAAGAVTAGRDPAAVFAGAVDGAGAGAGAGASVVVFADAHAASRAMAAKRSDFIWDASVKSVRSS